MEYKNILIQKNKNYKIGLFTEKENTYMSLDFDCELNNGRTMHYNIPKINLDSISMNCDYTNSSRKIDITLNTEPIDGKYATITDATKYKEMSVEDIEKELGYKIKLKNNGQEEYYE